MDNLKFKKIAINLMSGLGYFIDKRSSDSLGIYHFTNYRTVFVTFYFTDAARKSCIVYRTIENDSFSINLNKRISLNGYDEKDFVEHDVSSLIGNSIKRMKKFRFIK